jgi:ribose-phosphate pyrophosphokinase
MRYNITIGPKPNGISWIMPDGAPHCDISSVPPDDHINITAKIRSFNDFGQLLAIVDALEHRGKNPPVSIDFLYIPLRQDRYQENFPLTIGLYRNCLSRYDIGSFSFFHPHTTQLKHFSFVDNDQVVPKVNVYYPTEIWLDLYNKYDRIIIPDKGARSIIGRFARSLLRYGDKVVFCEKTRDSKTGKLSNPIVPIDGIKDEKWIILDDICDGGGTFNMLAEEIQKKNNVHLDLFVTHGIFSKKFSELKKNFWRIFSTNSTGIADCIEYKERNLTILGNYA